MGAIHAENFTDSLYVVANRSWLRTGYLRDTKVRYSDDATEREYTFCDRFNRRVISFRARPLPGCCGVLVVYYLRPLVGSEKAQTKLFLRTLKLIQEAASRAKYGAVLLSQTRTSLGYAALEREQHIPFTNWKTKNELAVFAVRTPIPSDYEAPAPKNFAGE